MRYLLMVCGDESAMANLDSAQMDRDTTQWVDEMDGRGIRKMGEPLGPASSATTVRVRNGDVLLSDGPFAETKEHVLGFDLIECEDLDEAIEVARKHPVARYGSIEVRPFWTS